MKKQKRLDVIADWVVWGLDDTTAPNYYETDSDRGYRTGRRDVYELMANLLGMTGETE